MANKEQITAFKKNNKVRREIIAKNFGFTSAAKYLESLSGTTSTPPKKVTGKSKPTIHNVYILDKSSSMTGEKFVSALEGINEEMDTLRQDKTANYLQYVVSFSDSHRIQKKLWGVPMANTTKFTDRASGMTALYQAVGETLECLQSISTKDKVLVKIFTDGGENDSEGRFKNPAVLAELIKEMENRGFTIAFMGTDWDTKQIINNLNISASNTLVHDNTAGGIKKAFDRSIGATMSFACAVADGQDVKNNFYKKTGKL